MATERSNLRKLLTALHAEGFRNYGVDNGDGIVRHMTDNAMIDEAFAADDAHVYVSHERRERPYFFYIVLGNSPSELVNDWGIDNEGFFDAVMDRVTGSFED